MTTSTASSSPPETGDVPGVPRTPAEVRALIGRLGVVPSRQFGQSFLVDPFTADAEVALLDTAPTSRVVEVGGGLGLLTEALLRRGHVGVTVIERDRRLAAHLRRTFGDRVKVVHGDALVVPLGSPDAVVGNLPFSTGTPILQRLFRERVPRVVALLQREVVDRLTASPGTKQYGRLTIQAALYGRAEAFQVVPSLAFEPAPAVEGRILRFTARDGPLPVPSVARFESAVHLLFSGRRKQLGNLLPRVVHPPLEPDEVAARAQWPPEWSHLRPEELAPEAYFRLAVALAGESAAPGPAAG
ncbi:MAG TPA: 16S rRNA (adenine(1518)-N(6)/adenine(1519)-N(6))-dimethyltransferase RsmA [Thermoplasmata archaeon]|nr:16S rRNA (adenine(1518)-N(6)/adenine(1519)-N(6))-dimethyltransferase RsmA [Thermoplasmata archaeon]